MLYRTFGRKDRTNRCTGRWPAPLPVWRTCRLTGVRVGDALAAAATPGQSALLAYRQQILAPVGQCFQKARPLPLAQRGGEGDIKAVLTVTFGGHRRVVLGRPPFAGVEQRANPDCHRLRVAAPGQQLLQLHAPGLAAGHAPGVQIRMLVGKGADHRLLLVTQAADEVGQPILPALVTFVGTLIGIERRPFGVFLILLAIGLVELGEQMPDLTLIQPHDQRFGLGPDLLHQRVPGPGDGRPVGFDPGQIQIPATDIGAQAVERAEVLRQFLAPVPVQQQRQALLEPAGLGFVRVEVIVQLPAHQRIEARIGQPHGTAAEHQQHRQQAEQLPGPTPPALAGRPLQSGQWQRASGLHGRRRGDLPSRFHARLHPAGHFLSIRGLGVHVRSPYNRRPLFRPFPVNPDAMTAARQDTYELNKLHKRLRRETGQAIADFNMIEDGDRVMVCLSGGKDSYTLLDILMNLQQAAPVKFELHAVNLDQKQPGFPEDILPAYLAGLGVSYDIINEDTYSVVTRVIPEGKTMCSLCSRLRRGVLYSYAQRHGYNKIALGHHRDDILETFFLNFFYGGKLKSMPPKLVSDDGKNIVIRPLAYSREKDIARYAMAKQFPIIPCNLCGSQENLQRKVVKMMMQDWDRKHPGRIETMFRALQNVVPSHLADTSLYDFRSLVADGVAREDGDKGFDSEKFAEPEMDADDAARSRAQALPVQVIGL